MGCGAAFADGGLVSAWYPLPLLLKLMRAAEARFGSQMAHICHSNIAYFDLAASACINRSKEAAIHALLLDPLTQAILTPREIKQMTLEMIEAESDYLPGYT